MTNVTKRKNMDDIAQKANGAGHVEKHAHGKGEGKPRRIHPGAGRRNAPLYPKGRVLRQEELAAVVRIVGPGPYERPLLIEYLHNIQDAEGCLPAAHLHGLSELLHIAQAEVYEVATFYAHFDVVADGEERPEKITVRVCDSLSCMMAGAEKLIAELGKQRLDNVRVLRAPCLGSCHTAPAVHVGHHHVDQRHRRQGHEARLARCDASRNPGLPGLSASYESEGGYARSQGMSQGRAQGRCRHRDDVGRAAFAGLAAPASRRGASGASCAARKVPASWPSTATRASPARSRTGIYLETKPHQFLEGMLIAAWAVEATDVFIYMRDEYPAVLEILRIEIPKLQRRGLAAHEGPRAARRRRLHLRRRKRDDRVDRGQARLAAASPALRRAGRHLRPADARQQYRDAVLGAEHPGERRDVVRRGRARTAPRACAPTRCRDASRNRASC